MNWILQPSVAFQLLNNAALLAVGTLGYCALRRRIEGRMPYWAQSLVYGIVFGLLSDLTSLAPLTNGPPVSLRFVPLVIATLFCGVTAGGVASLLLIVSTIFLLHDDPTLGIPYLAVASFAVGAAYRLLLLAGEEGPRVRDLAIVAVGSVLAMLAAAAWIWGLARFEVGFEAIGPAWVVLSVSTVVVLGLIIRHVARSEALARAVDENERRFRSFYNESPVMLTAIDREERIVAASDRWLEVMGYRREEVIGRSRYDFLASGSSVQLRERVLPALRQGRKLGAVEVQLKRKDGLLVHASTTSVVRRDPVTGGEEILNFSIDETARREVERALAERESQLRAIVDNAPVGIFLKDRESRYRLVNSRFEKWTRGAVSDVIGRADSDFLPAEEGRAIRAADLKVLEEGIVYQTERQPVLPETPDQYLLVTKFPIRGADGSITGIAGFTIDISERKRAETALAERERDLRAIMDNAPFAIFLKDRGGRYRMVNRCYTEWFGRNQQDMEGRTSAELYSAPIAAMNARADAEVHVGRVVVQERARVSARTSIGHLQITQFPIRDEAGEIAGSAGFCADITERNRAETALRESQELLVEAQKLGRVGHILIDRVAKRVRWSDSVFEMRGVPWRESFSFEEAITFLHPDDRATYEAARDAAIAERRNFELDMRALRSDGSICWEHSIGHPRYDATGQCTGILVVLRDISEERQAEQELRESRELLIQSQRLGKIGHLVSDRRTNRVHWSDTLFELRGIPKRDYFTLEETDKTPHIHPEDGARFLAERDAGVAGRRDFAVDIRVQRPGGAYAWESVRGRPRFAQDGTLESVLYVLQDITERKEADEALRRKEAELRAIMDNAPLAIFLKDREGRYRLVNRCYRQWMLGGRRRVDGRTSDEIFPSEVAREMTARDREVLERGTVSTAEISASYFDPKYGIEHALVTKFPVRDDAGAIVGIAGFAMDITDRKRAELERRESRELLLESQRIGKIGYAISDVAENRVRWSDTLFEMRRLPPRDSFTAEEARAFILPEDRAAYIRIRNAAVSARRDFEYDARIRLGDGTIAWEHGIGHLRYDAAGNCVSILFVIQDVTEARLAAEALKRKEAELRAIMDNAPFAIFLKDRGRRYRLVNSTFTDWFGDRLEDLAGRTATEHYPAEQSARWEASDRELMATGRIAEEERPVYKAKPGIEYVHATKFPIRDEDGTIVGMAGFIADVTARKRAELALSEVRLRLQAIMENAPFAIFLKDREGRHQLVNRAYTEWFGERLEDVVGRTARDLYPAATATKWEAADRKVMETGSIVEEERRPVIHKSALEYLRETKFPVRDERGEIVGVAGFIADISARERAERALRETQMRLQAIMDNAPFAVFLKDVEGRYRLINRAYTEWFGDRAEDLIGRTAAEVYPREQVETWEAVDREIMRTGRVATQERQVQKAKSGIEYVLTTKFPVRDAGGTTVGFAGIVADITGRKRTEIALEESRRLLLESQRIGKLAYIVSDVAKDRVVWSDSLFELRKVPRREAFTFVEARDFLHPDDLEDYLARRAAAIAERRDFEADVRVRHGDGSWGWEHSIVHFRFDEAGNCLSSLALVQDVTERKRTEEAIRHNEERFRALIEHSNDIVTVADRHGTITYRSPSSREVMGYDDSQMVGQSIFERVHPEDIGTLRTSFASLVGKPELRAEGRSRVRHQDGAWRTLAWSARDASTVPGIEGIIVNSRDVTESQLLEEQLRESQKMEAVGQLAGGIAHDFNNILGAILGFAGFLLQDLPKETPEFGFAERIVAASERGKELVRQILAFSRRSTVERKPTDLAHLLEETRELLRASLPSSAGLEVALPNTRLVAEVNAAQISQILFNLCLNANDALQGEPGRIAVELQRIEAARADRALLGNSAPGGAADAEAGRIVFGSLKLGRAYARIGVSDTGTGMAPDVLKRIFDPFFTTKGRGRGTGLGLSVVHGIVMAYEGAILVTSRPSAGSTFHVYLPLADRLPEGAGPERSARTLEGHERVLVVDDEVVMTDVITMALDRLGYETAAINDPQEALEIFSGDPAAWDVVVSDQVMPGMKGLTLVQRLKAVRPTLRCILCTGFSDGATEEGAKAAGVDLFLAKPTAPEEIAAAIRKLFDPERKPTLQRSRSRT